MIKKGESPFDDSVQIIDEEDYTYGKEGLGAREIILSHLKHICDYVFKGKGASGYSMDSKGGIKKEADYREIVMEAIDILSALLKPHYDDIMWNADKRFEKTKEEIEKALTNSYLIKNFKPHQIIQFKKSQILRPVNKNSADYEAELSWKWANYMKLLTEQNFLLKRLNYLSAEDYGE